MQRVAPLLTLLFWCLLATQPVAPYEIRDEAAATIISRLRRVRESQPLAATVAYADAVDQLDALNETEKLRAGWELPRQLDLVDDAASTNGLLKDFDSALALRHRALRLRLELGDASEALQGFIAVADALVLTGAYAEAADVLATSRALVHDRITKEGNDGLLRVEAGIMDCRGNSSAALILFQRSLGVEVEGAAVLWPPPGVALTQDTVKVARDYLQLLFRAAAEDVEQRALLGLATNAAANAEQQQQQQQIISATLDALGLVQPSARLSGAISHLTSALLGTGHWVNALQLPRNFKPGLSSRPWHSVRTHYPHLAPFMAALEAAHEALSTEYRALKANGRLLRETECIHDASSGAWSYFSINGYWLREVDDVGCSVHSPVACSLARVLANLPGVSINRAGYSIVGGRTVLRPHWGITNAQLKFHLGLIVPKTPDGRPCTRLTVGGKTRSWRAGKALFFDDSFLHSVVNECEQERVVFQVVIVHPDKLPAVGG